MKDHCKRGNATYTEQIQSARFDLDSVTRRLLVLRKELAEDADLSDRPQLARVANRLRVLEKDKLDPVWQVLADLFRELSEGGDA